MKILELSEKKYYLTQISNISKIFSKRKNLLKKKFLFWKSQILL